MRSVCHCRIKGNEALLRKQAAIACSFRRQWAEVTGVAMVASFRMPPQLTQPVCPLA
jgi:hypothetical protein